VLAALCSLAFLTYLDRICIMRVQGDIADELRLRELTVDDEADLAARGLTGEALVKARAALGEDRANRRLSWIFAAFLVGYTLFEVPGGWLGDVWGSRLVITRIVIWWSAFTALTGCVVIIARTITDSPTVPLLVGTMVLIRFLFGLGEAGAYPNVGRALGRWFPFHARAAAQGVIWMSSRLGGAAAPLIIGTLTAAAGGWKQAFWILGAVGVVWAAWFFWWFRDRPEQMPGVNAAESGLIRGGGDAGAGSIYDDHHHAGVPWLRLLSSANLWAIYVAGFTISFSWYFYVTFLPKYLKDTYGVDYTQSQVLTGLPLLVGGVSCLIGGRLSDYLIRRTGSRRWGRAIIGLTAYAAAAVCALVITQIDLAARAADGVDSESLARRQALGASVIAVICVLTAFQDLAVPVIWSLAADIGGRYAGTVGGAINSIGAVGGALSPFFAAALGFDVIFYIYAGSYLLGALMWLRINAGETLIQAGEGVEFPNETK
jgi:MFS family permease